MSRVTESDVLAIIETKLVVGQVTPFINTANLIVEGHLGSSGLDETLLTEIEKYLAAHCLSTMDQRLKSEKFDVVSYTYTGTFGEGLKLTQYGQMAILLDTSGTLGKIAEGGYLKKASMTTLEYHES